MYDDNSVVSAVLGASEETAEDQKVIRGIYSKITDSIGNIMPPTNFGNYCSLAQNQFNKIFR